MKYGKAKMFNRKASNSRNKPNQILEALALQSGQHIADIGAGGGYFSLRFADVVGREGKVYAIDTSPDFLEFISKSATEKGLNNVETILATEDNVTLPKGSLDLIFLRNVYHHLSNRIEYIKKLGSVLKSDGRIAIIEYKKGGRLFSFHRMCGHYVPRESIVKEMEEARYRLIKEFNFLPEQSFTIFSFKNRT